MPGQRATSLVLPVLLPFRCGCSWNFGGLSARSLAIATAKALAFPHSGTPRGQPNGTKRKPLQTQRALETLSGLRGLPAVEERGWPVGSAVRGVRWRGFDSTPASVAFVQVPRRWSAFVVREGGRYVFSTHVSENARKDELPGVPLGFVRVRTSPSTGWLLTVIEAELHGQMTVIRSHFVPPSS